MNKHEQLLSFRVKRQKQPGIAPVSLLYPHALRSFEFWRQNQHAGATEKRVCENLALVFGCLSVYDQYLRSRCRQSPSISVSDGLIPGRLSANLTLWLRAVGSEMSLSQLSKPHAASQRVSVDVGLKRDSVFLLLHHLLSVISNYFIFVMKLLWDSWIKVKTEWFSRMPFSTQLGGGFVMRVQMSDKKDGRVPLLWKIDEIQR